MTSRTAAEAPFDTPAQARAFALVLALLESGRLDPRRWRDALATSIAARPRSPYWESWVTALEELALD